MPDPGPGSMTFFYTNQQSARLMFYHDHAYGITRLTVYAGEEAGYLISDPAEQYLIARARWRILDTIKRERIRRCTSLDDDLLPLADTHNTGCPDEEAYASEFARQLAPTQRRVLDCLLRGLTFRQTGEVLGCASANIAYHVRKIRRSYEEWV
jgi:DNA-directed RNA polymerase specialized sigma24 family protein